jgi:hypothetical protein
MLGKSWRYLMVLLALGLLASLTVGAAVAAQPGKGKGNGPKIKGKIVHVNGTVVSTGSNTLTVAPKQKGKATPTAAAAAPPVTFTIATNTKLAAEGAAPGAAVTLSQFAQGARVNVVGRMSADGKTVVAKVAVLLGPEDDSDDSDD